MTLDQPLLVNDTQKASSEIRCLGVEELYRCRECFFNFFHESNLPGKPDFSHWHDCWTHLISNHLGYLVAAIRDYPIIGVLGGICYPCMLTKDLEMIEAFWWVQPKYRGGPTGVRLFKYFEKLSEDIGAKRIKMVHLSHINPATMKDIYQRMGYREIEIGYMKEIKEGGLIPFQP